MKNLINKLALVAWDKVYFPKLKGGIVSRDMKLLNNVLSAKT